VVAAERDLAELIEGNVAAFLLEMGATGGGYTRADDEATWTLGGSPIGYHNAVVSFTVTDQQRARAIVAEWEDARRARDLPGSWHLTPSMQTTGVQQLLERGGYVDGGEEPAMAADLATIGASSPTDLRISKIVDADGMRDYRDVLASGFGEGPKEADWVAVVFTKIGFAGRWHHYVGRSGDTPVATCSLLLTSPVAGIYFVCTQPAHRRHGYGAAITRHAMSNAAELGASHAVLGSSPMGQGVYERLGFRTVFSYRLMEIEP
jgi:GNAT superfamily N-acetyltransferase